MEKFTLRLLFISTTYEIEFNSINGQQLYTKIRRNEFRSN